MKRLRDFLIVLCILLIILYAQAVLSPHTAQKIKPDPIEQTRQQASIQAPTSLQGKMPAQGLSQWIGKKADTFKKAYGTPTKVHFISEQKQWWVFGEESADFFEVLIEENKVESIFVLGPTVDADNFRVGMHLQELTTITTFYSDFTFTYQDVEFKVELTEEDLNYQPLVAFDNNSFAMLVINRETSQLLGIRYLSPKLFIDLQPYLLQSETNALSQSGLIDQTTKNEMAQKEQLLTLLNVMRDNQELPALSLDVSLDMEASRYLDLFTEEKDNILESNRQIYLDKIMSERVYNQSFYLDKKETQELATLATQEFTSELDQTKEKETQALIENHSLIYTPTRDIPLLAIEWYAELSYLAPFNGKKINQIGLSFKEPFVMVLLSE